MPVYQHERVTACFPDAAVGLSVSALLSNVGVFHVKITPGAAGELFSLLSPDYSIRLVVLADRIRFSRNAFTIEKLIGQVRDHYQVLVSWKPDRMQVAVMIDDQVGGDDACTTLDTAPLYVPASLLEWARRFTLAPRSTYSSAADFLGVLLESIRHANRRVRDTDSVALFWDRQRARNAKDRWVPKHEPDSMAGIAGFMQDQALLAGYQLIQESKAGSGSVDLRAIAALTGGGFATICIEGKNAHSGDLTHGVTDQLPSYMQSAKAAFGVYLVLWYRCKEFDEPNVADLDLTWSLTKSRPWDTIAVERFDLGFPLPPSNPEHRLG